MEYSESDVFQYIAENDVKFIKLFFTDIFGTIKSISIQPCELAKAFAKGISFDANGIKGFLEEGKTDLFIIPDPATLCALPWRPQHGRVVRFFCNVHNPDGSIFGGDSRHLLKMTEDYAAQKNYRVQIGTESEFYLFLLDERGNPTNIPQDNAGYCDLAPDDKGENVRRDICLTLIDMGLQPEMSHHERGPGQQEIDFKYDSLLKAGDNVGTFKTVVKTIAARNGLYASFNPKPLQDRPGSGMHINISLLRGGRNIFAQKPLPVESNQFIAGILSHIAEITAFLNPLPESYQRLGSHEAPKFITWSHENRSQLLRIPADEGERERLELRSPDPMCNQYIALSLIIRAGFDGIEKNMTLCAPTDINMYEARHNQVQNLPMLPRTLKEAAKLSSSSQFVKEVLPEELLNAFLSNALGE